MIDMIHGLIHIIGDQHQVQVFPGNGTPGGPFFDTFFLRLIIFCSKKHNGETTDGFGLYQGKGFE